MFQTNLRFLKKTTEKIAARLFQLQSILRDLLGDASPLKKFLLPPMLLAQVFWTVLVFFLLLKFLFFVDVNVFHLVMWINREFGRERRVCRGIQRSVKGWGRDCSEEANKSFNWWKEREGFLDRNWNYWSCLPSKCIGTFRLLHWQWPLSHLSVLFQRLCCFTSPW